MEIKSNIRESKMRKLYGMEPKFRLRSVPYTFEPPSDVPQSASHKQIKCAVVINPMPSAIFKIDQSGARIATGSGESMHGYTIYSGTGFIESMLRDIQ